MTQALTLAGRTVLVVDDDDSIREITRCVLELLGGCAVLDTDGGVSALDLAAQHQPDVILLDVMMPDMDGPATVRALRADPRTERIPVVMLTAKARFGEDVRHNELNVAGVITKPFDPQQLVGEIERLLDDPASHGSLVTA